jgi:hypothetical protein
MVLCIASSLQPDAIRRPTGMHEIMTRNIPVQNVTEPKIFIRTEVNFYQGENLFPSRRKFIFIKKKIYFCQGENLRASKGKIYRRRNKRRKAGWR